MKATPAQFRWLSGVVRQLYAAQSYAEMHGNLLPALYEQFGLVNAMCESCSPDITQTSIDGLYTKIAMPPAIPLSDIHLYIWDNPVVIRVIAGDQSPVMRVRENLPLVALERTDFYRYLVQPFGVGDGMYCIVRTPQRIYVITHGRKRPFDDKEAGLLALLHPHLHATLIRVAAHAVPRVPLWNDPIIPVDASGRPIGLKEAQADLLRAFFPDWRRSRRSWPGEVKDWLDSVRRKLADTDRPAPPPALWRGALRGRLALRYFPQLTGGGGTVRLIESPAPADLSGQARRAGLSPRECEVVQWLTAGKSDREIAIILGRTTATINRHAHNIRRKLGVSSRTAAVAALLGHS